MQAEAMVRSARRRAGLSQRELARRAGVSATTVVAIESGRQLPSLRVLQALVAVAGLDVTVDRPLEPLCTHVRRHLHLSLSVRLHLALGGQGRPWQRPVLPAWHQLGLLATSGRVFATGDLATSLWLPATEPVTPVTVGVQLGEGMALPATPQLDVAPARLPSLASVTVPLTIGALHAPPPGELALDPAHAGKRRALRAVAAELELHAPRDPGGRRSPPHREPQREDEVLRLLFARPWNSRFRPPDRLDGRGWRLDDEVGVRGWIERRAERG